jgi:uncharacterized protein YbjT (DUF2867 family)
MRIVVIGGSGLVGARIVEKLAERAHDVVSASPSSGVNTITGEGLFDVLQDASVVVDVSDRPSFDGQDAMAFFEASTRRLLAAEASTSVQHHVSLSVIGAERLTGSDYFRAKVAQDVLIRTSPIPYSIVHATQVFEVLECIARAATKANTVRPPSVLTRPITAADVASVVCGVAVGAPLNAVVEVAGPEEIRLDALVEQELSAHSDPRKVVSDTQAPYLGTSLSERTLVRDAPARYVKTPFEEWLDLHVPQALL